MKSNWIAPLFVACAAMASTAAHAAPWVWTGTVADWAAAGTINDADGDMRFVWNPLVSNNIALTTKVTLSEIEIGGSHIYDVGFDFSPVGTAGPVEADYFVQTVSGLPEITSAALSLTQTGTLGLHDIMENLRDTGPGDVLFASLSVPPSPDNVNFSARASISVQDIIPLETGGVAQDIHNGFTVPEPTSLALVALSLFALPISRRRKA